ncbi:TPA: hypothetical protein ACXHW4_004259 [Enterobacter hormaechei]
MRIQVHLKESELEEMGMTKEELRQSIIADLDNSDVDGEYVGFTVTVYVTEGI